METTKGPIYQMVEDEYIDIIKIANPDSKSEYCIGYRDAFLQILPKIAELENEQNKWISVYERLPSSYETVLTYSPELGYREGEWLEIELSWFTNMGTQRLKGITHWMPLPPKPTTNK